MAADPFPESLDDFTLCEVPGCIWRVLRPATLCSQHSDYRGPEYAEADDGSLLDARHMNLEEQP